ncbi:hypothetical protein ACFLQR_03220 [Verrucomicrobiota bacterium]
MAVTRTQVDEKIEFLHSHPNIPSAPTAEPIYKLPRSLKRNVITSRFSQESLQELSDNIGYFLGLLHSLKVTIKIERTDYDMLAQMGLKHDTGGIGLYKVTKGTQREIQLTKKFRFRFKHVLAVLVHESMHNYLDDKGVRQENNDQNEILTDVAAAYFGLGQAILKGYQPIVWTSDEWWGSTTHLRTIGYVPVSLIGYAVYRAGLLRNASEFLKICPLRFRIALYFKLRAESRLRQRDAQALSQVVCSLEEAREQFHEMTRILGSTSATHMGNSVLATDANLLVELSGLIATGDFERALNSVGQRLHNGEVDSTLVKEAEMLCSRVARWKIAVDACSQGFRAKNDK